MLLKYLGENSTTLITTIFLGVWAVVSVGTPELKHLFPIYISLIILLNREEK